MDQLAIGTITNFTKGWAIIPLEKKPHYWVEIDINVGFVGECGRVKFYTSLCGLGGETNSMLPPIVPGNFPKCKRCLKLSKAGMGEIISHG